VQGQQGLQGPVGPAGTRGLQGIQGPTGATGAQGIQGQVGPTGAQGIQGQVGPTGAQGIQGQVGPTGPSGTPGSSPFIETYMIANTNYAIPYNVGSGNNEAVGALVFNGATNNFVNRIGCYILQRGAGTGRFQMALLRPVSNNSSEVIAVTQIVTSITPGLFILPFLQGVTLTETVYHMAVYNQVNASEIAGMTSGIGSGMDAPPINFRTQNLSGFTVGQTINTSDVSLRISPWLAMSD